jgi:sorting nexin-1/2
MVERWPGIFIPKLPNKKKVGNKGKNISVIRVEMLNRFLKKISKIKYLLNSEELGLFLQNTSNVGRTLDGLKEQTYEDLSRKYFSTFLEYDSNFDTITGKNEQDIFEKKLVESLPKIKNFILLVSAAMEKYRDEQENYSAVINMLSLYEKESLSNFVNNEEDKLVFFNTKNQELCQNITDSQKQVINPYDRLYSAITDDYLNCESMIETLEGLKALQDSYNKLNKNLSTLNIELSELQAGKSSVKNMFKNKEKEITRLNNEKENLEKNIDGLGNVIKVATFVMQKEIKEFKINELNNYYAELSRIENDTAKNSKLFDDLWDNVIKDKNISEFK